MNPWLGQTVRAADRTCSATPTPARWSEYIGSSNPFIMGRFGSPEGARARRVPTQEAEDSGSHCAKFRARL